MSKRIILIALLAAWPFAALADDSSSSNSSTDPQATSGYNASNLGPSAGASSLGPTTSSGDSSANGDSSTATGSALQPAGSSSSPLQSDNNGQSLGASTSPASALQAPATQNSLQVLQGEADGPPHTTDNSFPVWVWIALTAAFAGVVAVAIWLWRRHPGSPRTQPETPILDNEAEALDAPEVPAEPTTSQRLSITIDRPVAVVFEYVLNPKNTPKWVPAFQSEEASEQPAKLGTIYKNQDTDGNWSEYEITQFSDGESFVMSKKDSTYHVRYSLQAEGNATELEYYEWMDEGNLALPFTSKELALLKLAIEKPPQESTTADTTVASTDKPEAKSKERDKPAKA